MSYRKPYYIAPDGARSALGACRQILDGRAAARANYFVKPLQARQGAHMYTRCFIGLLALHMTTLTVGEQDICTQYTLGQGTASVPVE